MTHNPVKKLTRTEMRIVLNAHRGTVDLTLKSLTDEELWQLILKREAEVAAKLEQAGVDNSTLH
ncbi:hypothetical protein FNL55_12335 [Tardiphaga sp. vice352]|uniref:hypothetical protein n=1 Tax=unclassified Tardiphaga TaxID=2631404 RepID=UPI001161FD4E|nr:MULTISPECIES: hypothetical protein [unclassified Tardiphaga]MBC7623394.1 hypothetical protein [Burkholderiales bacterium]QDM16754.1 hypothetical protein FNL53_13045 [Tardiphaga sp. vice278]QDM32029.1 hypothetical protein FNL55_12335 [Tardiphaga sp. vice352]